MNLEHVTFPMLPVRPSWRTIPTDRKIIAHAMVRDALTSGIITKQPCCICGKAKADAHHEDYQRPNQIVWLCDIHHRSRHWELGWGMRGGDDDYDVGNTPDYLPIPWPHTFGSFSNWDANKQKDAVSNKENELLWLLENYDCVKICYREGYPKALRQIFFSAIAKFNLVSFTLAEFERIEATRLRLHYDARPPMYRDAILAFIEADEAAQQKIIPLSAAAPAPASIAAEATTPPPVTEPRQPVTYTKRRRPK